MSEMTPDALMLYAAEDERETIVRFLRARAAIVRGTGESPSSVLLVATTLDEAASDIMRGDHRRPHA